MKKEMKIHLRIYFVLLLIMVASGAKAQLQETRQDFSFGFNGGMNLNSVSFTPSVKQKMNEGLVGGITGRMMCEKYFSLICGIQAEVNYSQRGWTENIDTTVSKDTYSRTMNYVEIPFLAHIAFGKDAPKGVQGFINIGPQVAFLISEKEHKSWSDTVNIANLNRENSVNYQYIKAQSKFDYGLVGGGGVEIRTGAGSFLIEGRYYFGLSDFFNTGEGTREFQRAAHQTISLRLTYLFNVPKKK